MSNEQKKEAREIIEELFTKLDGIESDLKEIYQLGKETENRRMMNDAQQSLVQVGTIRSRIQISLNLNLY